MIRITKKLAWAFLFLTLGAVAIPLLAAQLAKGDEANAQNPQSLVLLDFYSDWCGPCQSMRPTVDVIARDYPVRRVNIDDEPGLAAQFGVTSIPCFVVVENGREIDRVVGVTSAERLKASFRSHRTVKKSKEKIIEPRPGSDLRPTNGRPAFLGERVLGQSTPFANINKTHAAEKIVTPVPTPAWRYETAEGYRQSVVRIYCRNDAKSGDIGSGVFLQWNGRPVVLTARHVVADAKTINLEFFDGRKRDARVLRCDATWDAAVLEPIGDTQGIPPAEIEFGNRAMQNAGDSLESCGYGPDGRLACNHGAFVGYRRSSASLAGPDDWMIVSGHARQGDSGGPIFNSNGRVVGVIWGYDPGKPNRERPQPVAATIAGVQAGRLHLLLDAAVPEAIQPTALVDVRVPTPAKEGDATCNSGCDCAAGVCDLTAKKKEPILKWRRETQHRDDAQDARIEALIALQEQQARSTPPVNDAKIVPTPAKEAEKSSMLAMLLVVAGSLAVGGVFCSVTKKKTA